MDEIQKKIKIKEYFDSVASQRLKWRKKAAYFHRQLSRYIGFSIQKNCSVLEFGCEAGDLLESLKPSRAVGVDYSKKMVELAKEKFPHLDFRVGDIDDFHSLRVSEKFDYIIVGSVIGYVSDIQNALTQLRKVSHPSTRVIIVYYNYLWEPLLKLSEALGLRMKRPGQHWFSSRDLENFLELAGFETIKKDNQILIPFYIPLLSTFLNRFFANVWFFRKLSLVQMIYARPIMPRQDSQEVSCSVIIPCRNERGNIEQLVLRLPPMGKKTELIFIEGHSQDDTLSECERVRKKYANMHIKVFTQDGEGKGDAVRKGFANASEDILMILDADLTVPPEELPKFFEAIALGKGELINGSRLVYKMEKQAMRFLNLIGNKFFSFMFTFLLEQYIKDTLCGTKALRKSDYERIAKEREYFGHLDPFGDFDLLFGAAKLNLKIIEIPVHYRERTYGSTQIRRFKHGWLLLKMTAIAMKKLKFV